MAYRPAAIAARLNANAGTKDAPHFIRHAIAYAVCWPIIAACSVRVWHKDAPFKAEYVIPNLLTQWVKLSCKCEGVRYFSCLVDKYGESIAAVANYAFPCHDLQHGDYCKSLRAWFELTDPIGWYGALTPAFPSGLPRKDFQMSLDNCPVMYGSTDFAKIEMGLSSISVQRTSGQLQ